MGLNFSSTIRNVLMSFIFSLMLIPALVSASTEFKGTETVNINKANAATLAAYLKGVGPSKAEAIVKYRKSNGNFKKIDDLKNVPGIGDETYKDVKKNVSTSRGKSAAPKGYKMSEASTSSKKSSAKKATSKKTSSSSSSKTSSSSSKKKSSKLADVEKKSPAKKTTSKKTSSSKKTTAKKAAPKKKTTTKKASTKKASTKKKTTTKKKKPVKKKTTKKKSS